MAKQKKTKNERHRQYYARDQKRFKELLIKESKGEEIEKDDFEFFCKRKEIRKKAAENKRKKRAAKKAATTLIELSTQNTIKVTTTTATTTAATTTTSTVPTTTTTTKAVVASDSDEELFKADEEESFYLNLSKKPKTTIFCDSESDSEDLKIKCTTLEAENKELKKKIMKLEQQLKNKRIEIFVSNLSPNTGEHDVKLFFEQYGEVIYCNLIKDFSGNSRGYAYVTMPAADGRKAIEKTNRVEELNGWTLNVSESQRQNRNRYGTYGRTRRNNTGPYRGNFNRTNNRSAGRRGGRTNELYNHNIHETRPVEECHDFFAINNGVLINLDAAVPDPVPSASIN